MTTADDHAAETFDFDRLRSTLSKIIVRERKAGHGRPVLLCHQTLRYLHRLDRLLKGEASPTDDSGSVQRGTLWDWFRRLLGVRFCTDIDASGAYINANGDIQDPLVGVIQCPSGVQCDEVNNLWLCN